jgi:rod shape-determining protein MreC
MSGRTFTTFLPVFLFLVALGLISAQVKGDPDKTAVFLGNSVPLETLGPLSRLFNAASDGVERCWQNYFYLVSVKAENDQLRQTIERLRHQIVELEEFRHTNNNLSKLLGLKEKLPDEFLAGRILAWDPGPWYQAVVIDVGAQEGVVPEAAVLNDQGLIGRVVELAPHESKVLLLTDLSSGADGFIQRNRVNVLVTGHGAGQMTLEFVRKSEDVRLGDLVVSSGLDGLFPAGHPIGVVTQVDKAGLGLFLHAELRPTVDFSGLKEILILKDKPRALDWPALGRDLKILFEKKQDRPGLR